MYACYQYMKIKYKQNNFKASWIEHSYIYTYIKYYISIDLNSIVIIIIIPNGKRPWGHRDLNPDAIVDRKCIYSPNVGCKKKHWKPLLRDLVNVSTCPCLLTVQGPLAYTRSRFSMTPKRLFQKTKDRGPKLHMAFIFHYLPAIDKSSGIISNQPPPQHKTWIGLTWSAAFEALPPLASSPVNYRHL